MKEFMYDVIYFVSRIHTKLLEWNYSSEHVMTDKQLHFLVMGMIGMALLFVIYPLFILLAKKHVLVIAWIYVFTLMVVIAFAIEIGQGLTGTGVMDFSDATSGLTGFMWMFFIFAAIRMVFLLFRKVFRSVSGKGEKKGENVTKAPACETNERKPDNNRYRRAHTATFHSV